MAKSRNPPSSGPNLARTEYQSGLIERGSTFVRSGLPTLLPVWRPIGRLGSILNDLPWRIIGGSLLAAIPMSLLGLVAGGWSVALAGVVALVLSAFASYLADWVGGFSALVTSLLLLNLYFVNGRTDLTNPVARTDRVSLVVIAVAGAVLVWLVQRIKSESTEDRQEAMAARSAATALAAIETVAATQQRLSYSARRQIYDSIVRAVVGVNRAHAGALLLTVPGAAQLIPDASYGFGEQGNEALREEGTGRGLVARIAIERRAIQVYDVRSGSATRGAGLQDSPIRSLLGAPIISTGDRVLGVILLGLLVPHRFSSGEVKKLEAFSSQIAAILETMSVTGEREFELHQAREEQRRLERVIAAIPEAVVVIAPPAGHLVATNTVARSLFGDQLASDFYDLLQGPDGSPVDRLALPMQLAMDRGEPIEGIELAVKQNDGTNVPVLASAAPILGPDGAVTAVVGAFRDISTLKEATRMKDEFVSIVSHELRSPLTPIRGFVQLVARELAKEGNHDLQVQRLHSIDGHVDRLTRLVDDLLDVSRMKAGTIEIRPELTDLSAVCRDVVSVRSANEPALHLDLKVPGVPVVGEWDPDRLQQIVDNLIGNAIKYSPQNGVISVTVNAHPTEAELIVEDQGPGISEDERTRVFAAFYRTSSATSSQAPGLGLGLYICRELVEAHDGSIEVRATPGGGAAFHVRLPLLKQASGQAHQSTVDPALLGIELDAPDITPV